MKPYPTAPRHLSGDRLADVRHVTVGGYRTEPHAHDDEYMFLLPRTGQLILNVESNAAPLRVAPKSFVVVPPRRLHDTHGYRPQQEHVAVYVDSGFVADCERRARRSLSCSRISIWRAPPPLLDAVRAATGAGLARGELAAYRAELAARMVAAACVEAGLASAPLPPASSDAHRELVREIRAFLDATLDQPVGLDRIAYEFGLSRRTLTRIFRAASGESVVDYQARQRVARAALLLRMPGMTVVAAAAAVGLESPSYLARLFRKHGLALPNTLKR